MIIAVISDTHGHESSILRALKEAEKAEMIIHLGDNVRDISLIKERFKGDIVFVRGNGDEESYVPEDRLIEVKGKRIFLTHGHNYGVYYDPLKIMLMAKDLNAHIGLYGHTHVAYKEVEDGILILNPGSVSLPRDGRKSMAFIHINDEELHVEFKKLD